MLHCIVTAVISALHLKKKTSKLVNFCAVILILNMEENMKYFLTYHALLVQGR